MKVTFEERSSLHGSRIAIATLDAAQQLNALSLPMIEALLDRFTRWASDPGVVCVLLRGNGAKAFCAGGDVRRLAEACQTAPGAVPALAERLFADEYRLVRLVHHYPKPLLCWGHGYVMGSGMGLLQGATIRIVTPESQLAMPEVAIGLHTDVGASWFLPRLPGKLGLFLGLTGTSLNARDALDTGLADRCLMSEQQPELIEGLVQINWREQAAFQLHSLLRALARQAAEQLPEARLLPRREQIDELLDVTELPHAWQALAALEEDENEMLAQASRSLRHGCPLSAHLIWRQLDRGHKQSLGQALQVEYALSLNCCRHPEFAEGVRARLIDKDNQPNWHWPDVHSIPSAVIDAHFEPTWTGAHPLIDLS
ncbi:enoyl-CoA hydratase/isomerase family protein [Stutzerimonas decontaminans]|jgi:enoyl-CoA hydratase/carnithine racemase|uniref:3-hydroxyisobutyryl-CoA hydrolase n=1 Tax=Stutzerimonas decontaminans TaxID=3022791 RepID=A0ABX4VWV3_9GAMM|nr:enoyl-CoA hydratase/isomerase family protein [Stutzerimonas decontaminans]MCQ4243677.1 enoyl-CoA hydratase/isomerase family protein [Stutzerimonas decontaminans]PNF84629.1 enoyl-CoA hydratase/isomerase family protein [Stutzerimonas decontaminans]